MRIHFLRRLIAVGFVVALIACGKEIDPYAPKSRCDPGCTGSKLCEFGYAHLGPQCPDAPIDCGSFDASVVHCPPCFTGGSCVAEPECSPDDCDCVLAHRCPTDSKGAPLGKCTQTSSGRVDFFCYQT